MSGLHRILQLHQSREDYFTALVRPHIQLMYRMAYRWTQDRDEAEDLVQDVLTRLVPKADELGRVDKLSPWLIKVLYRRYVDLYRRNVRSPIDRDVSWSSDEEFYADQLQTRIGETERLELQRVLNSALATLADEQRNTVLLHDVEGYSLIEVAEVMEVSVGTVKSRLHRARKKLKHVLQHGTFTADTRVNRKTG